MESACNQGMSRMVDVVVDVDVDDIHVNNLRLLPD